MTTFVGYSTIDQFKKFTLVDLELIKRDLLNAFNIRQGQLVGRPSYGTTLWDFLFESQMSDTEQAIQEEIQRVVGGDPRIFIVGVPQLFPQDNGLLIQLDVQAIPSSEAERLSIFFNVLERRASYL
jgi:phage baseplate assembly protein W